LIGKLRLPATEPFPRVGFQITTETNSANDSPCNEQNRTNPIDGYCRPVSAICNCNIDRAFLMITRVDSQKAPRRRNRNGNQCQIKSPEGKIIYLERECSASDFLR